MGSLAIVKALIGAGADVNVPGPAYETPMHDAVAHGHADIVQVCMPHE